MRFTDTYIGRVLAWRTPTVGDIERFPLRWIEPSGEPSALPEAADAGTIRPTAFEEIVVGLDPPSEDFEELLRVNNTTSFTVVKDGTVAYSRYFAGQHATSPVALMSISKTVVATLVGISIGNGVFESVHEPITKYVPELSSAGFDRVTIQHLLSMTSGLRYSHRPLPWSGAARSYHATDRVSLITRRSKLAHAPMTEWNYNEYGAAMLALAMVRATSSTTFAAYSAAELLHPLGMPDAACWLLDNASPSAFENAGAGLYATARTLAKFGQMYLAGGVAGERRIVSEEWVWESTRLTPDDPSLLSGVQTHSFKPVNMGYKYGWWLWPETGSTPDFCAIGTRGQYIFVSPRTQTIVVRTGRDWGEFGKYRWLDLVRAVGGANQENSPSLS